MASRKSARLSAAADSKPAAEVAATSMPPPPTTSIKKRKVTDTAGKTEPAPSTPRKKRVLKTAAPPATPTPSAVGLIAEPASPSRRPKKARQTNGVTRVADPLSTNAPLLSPETSRIVAPKPIDAVSPSKAARTTTTANILAEACAHLIRVDSRMRPLVEKHHCRLFSPEGLAEKIDPFEALTSGIISQQVSGAAAKAIKGRFLALFYPNPESDANATTNVDADIEAGKRRFPHPSQVAAMPLERLRSAGLSQRKAEYVTGLAEKFASGELSAHLLAEAPFDEVIERLTAVRGLGRWSAEMFACFALKRMDVFSLGDLGVQRGCAAFVGRDVAKLKGKGGKWKYMSEQDMVELSDRFAPYRSLFMWYMWRVEETDVSTME